MRPLFQRLGLRACQTARMVDPHTGARLWQWRLRFRRWTITLLTETRPKEKGR